MTLTDRPQVDSPIPNEDTTDRGLWTLLADDCNLSAVTGSGIGLMAPEGDLGGFIGRGAGALYVWDKDSLGLGVSLTAIGPY